MLAPHCLSKYKIPEQTYTQHRKYTTIIHTCKTSSPSGSTLELNDAGEHRIPRETARAQRGAAEGEAAHVRGRRLLVCSFVSSPIHAENRQRCCLCQVRRNVKNAQVFSHDFVGRVGIEKFCTVELMPALRKPAYDPDDLAVLPALCQRTLSMTRLRAIQVLRRVRHRVITPRASASQGVMELTATP